MKTFTVTTPAGSRTVHADRVTFETSGHVAFWERRRAEADRLVLAVDDAITAEEPRR